MPSYSVGGREIIQPANRSQIAPLGEKSESMDNYGGRNYVSDVIFVKGMTTD